MLPAVISIQNDITSANAISSDSSIAALSYIGTAAWVFWINPSGAVEAANGASDTWDVSKIAQPGAAAVGGGIAALSRQSNTMELWYTSPTGALNGAYWYEGQASWTNYNIAPAGSAAPGSRIAAVSRANTTMEIWYVGAGGSMNGAYWYEGQGPWKTYTIVGPNIESQYW
jgi:hypothetical protein